MRRNRKFQKIYCSARSNEFPFMRIPGNLKTYTSCLNMRKVVESMIKIEIYMNRSPPNQPVCWLRDAKHQFSCMENV